MQLFSFATFSLIQKNAIFFICIYCFCICPGHCLDHPLGYCLSHCPRLLHFPFYYLPGYLMLSNLTNQVIKLSRCRPLVRMKFGLFRDRPSGLCVFYFHFTYIFYLVAFSNEYTYQIRRYLRVWLLVNFIYMQLQQNLSTMSIIEQIDLGT